MTAAVLWAMLAFACYVVGWWRGHGAGFSDGYEVGIDAARRIESAIDAARREGERGGVTS